MRQDIEEKIHDAMKKERERFKKNIPGNKCENCRKMPEGKFCSQTCYAPTIFQGRQYRAKTIIDIMEHEFKIKDTELFNDLCDELLMTYY